jgi:lipopolysaccharide/colanic/teichoic acid biosynthesis glycosyltransferase
LGWAEITHPFHPRQGERFRVLKTRRYRGEATLILEGGECGTFSILEDWTDKAAPTSVAAARLLSAQALLELLQLVQQLKGSGRPKAAEQKGVDTCV